MLSRPQSGVCAENSLHGLVILCQLREGQVSSAREKLAKIPALTKRLDERFSESLLSVVTAVGSRAWDRVSPLPRPHGLAPFPSFTDARYSGSNNQYDLAFIIRSDRLDANFFAGRVLLDWFDEDVQLAMEFNLFHYLDNRNLFGFKCPPRVFGRQREQTCLLDAPHETGWHRGSHLFLQHFSLHLQAWQELTLERQQQVMGWSKVDAEKRATNAPSHRTKTDIDANARIAWQQFPSACMREQGHIELLWSGSSEALTEFVRRRVEEDSDGFCDPLLEYQSNSLSSAFFVPPLAWFENLPLDKEHSR